MRSKARRRENEEHEVCAVVQLSLAILCASEVLSSLTGFGNGWDCLEKPLHHWQLGIKLVQNVHIRTSCWLARHPVPSTSRVSDFSLSRGIDVERVCNFFITITHWWHSDHVRALNIWEILDSLTSASQQIAWGPVVNLEQLECKIEWTHLACWAGLALHPLWTNCFQTRFVIMSVAF